MVKKFVSEGAVLSFTAPGGGVVSGGTYIIDNLPVVADGDAAATETFQGHVKGVFTLVKKSGAAWTAGDQLYYDVSEANWTKTASVDSILGGIAAADAASGDTTGDVLLTPQSKPGKAATIAALGATSNLVGVDGAGSNAAPLAGTETRLDNIETKVDAIIAALKVAQIVANA